MIRVTKGNLFRKKYMRCEISYLEVLWVLFWMILRMPFRSQVCLITNKKIECSHARVWKSINKVRVNRRERTAASAECVAARVGHAAHATVPRRPRTKTGRLRRGAPHLREAQSLSAARSLTLTHRLSTPPLLASPRSAVSSRISFCIPHWFTVPLHLLEFSRSAAAGYAFKWTLILFILFIYKFFMLVIFSNTNCH